VLNGHHNEFGEVFRRLVELEPGDEVLVYSGDLEFDYKVVLKMILPERNQPAEVRLANAAWIMPTEDERLTLVTCWPYESNSHRLILVAKPAQAAGPEDQPQLP
jgi:sortase A